MNSDPDHAGICAAPDRDPLLDELGAILLDCLRLDCARTNAVGHIIDAIRVCAQEAGLFDPRPEGRECALQPWQVEVATALLMSTAIHQPTIATVAAACGTSTSQFSRAFRTQFGLPPQQWRLAARIERAKRMMLEDTATLTDIALECGFTEQSHFNHIFLKRVGLSPSAWRRQNASST